MRIRMQTGFNGAATLSLQKLSIFALYVDFCVWLQWGRNLIVAEMRLGTWRIRSSHTASMGPQLYRCGNLEKTSLGRSACRCFNGAATLSLRKSRPCRTQSSSARPLQWGRNFIVAEMSSPTRMSSKSTIGFNVAATLSLRKSANPGTGESRDGASMGPQLYRCGNPVPVRGLDYSACQLQWSRNFIVAEI